MVFFLTGDVIRTASRNEALTENAAYPSCHRNSASLVVFHGPTWTIRFQFAHEVGQTRVALRASRSMHMVGHSSNPWGVAFHIRRMAPPR